MKKRLFLIQVMFLVLFFMLSNELFAKVQTEKHPAINAAKGWRLAVQNWSFNRFTFFEAIDKISSLGLSWMEAYPGQKLSVEYPNAKFDPSLSPELRKLVKARLRETGIRVVNFGVTSLPNDEKECRKTFDFAKEMGINTIMSEPKEDALDLIEKLAKEYKIQVAIHNHPKPSYYWHPETVLKVLEGRSKYLGACADNGHWMRSGIDPLKAFQMLEGKIISIHFKDLNEFGVREAFDVPWGTG
jgi:sugar phosphate isomerase/epimerase